MGISCRTICLTLVVVMMVAGFSGCGSKVEMKRSDALERISFRDIPGVTEEEIAEIDALLSGRDKFTYGACLSSEAFELPDGTLAGFSKDFCALLSELFGIDFILALYDWDVLINNLESETLDFTGELTITDERMNVYRMTHPIAERVLRIFTRADTEIKTEADVNGLKIGFLTGSIIEALIGAIYHLSFSRVVDVDSYDMAARMIESGEIDAFVDEAIADAAFDEYDFISSQIFFPLVYTPVSMATANPELAPLISVISKYIDAGGLDKLYELYKNGDFEYAKHKLCMSFTDAERAYIDDLTQRGAAVAVAFEHDNYPVNFYNEKTDMFEGISVDVLNEISRLTSIRFQPAVTKDSTFSEIYEKLNNGEVHMVAQLLFSQARKDKFLWSAAPYAQSYYAFMSKADYPDLAAYQIARTTVGAMEESGKIDVFYELFPNHGSSIKEYPTQYECLDALERGEIDLLMASEYMLLTQINFREKSGFKINLKLNTSLDSYFGFHKDEATLCSIIDKAQKYVETDSIEISWTGRNFDYSKRIAEETTRSLTIFLIIMSFVLTGTIFALVRNARLSRELKELANHDALTGVYNRRFFMELASFQIARSLREKIDCFVVIFDLDHFKAVNDTHGHLAGDKVLKDVAQHVKKMIRPYDVLGRYGGEEFIMLISDTKKIDKANVISTAERIREEICKTPIEFENRDIMISASFGIAYVTTQNDLLTATKCADKALYQAKEAGRNRVVFYEGENWGSSEDNA